MGKNYIEVNFEMKVDFIHQDYAKDNLGQVAIKYGPIFYCLEEADNEGLMNDNSLYISSKDEYKIVIVEKTFSRHFDEEVYPIKTNLIRICKDFESNKKNLILDLSI